MKHTHHRIHDNSKAAYASSDFNERERAILRVLGESSVPLTDLEISQRCGYGDNKSKVQPRITDMHNDHILCEGPKVLCRETGKHVRTSAIAVVVQQGIA